MTKKEIFTEVIKIRAKKAEIHNQLARCYLALNLVGESEGHEHRYKKEIKKVQKLEKFYQNHSHEGDNIYFKPVDVEDIFNAKNLFMNDKFNRFDVTPEMIRTKSKAYYYLWEEFLEKSLLSMEEHYISMLIGLKKPFLSHEILEEVECLADELAYVRSCIVKWNGMEWSVEELMEYEHEEYK